MDSLIGNIYEINTMEKQMDNRQSNSSIAKININKPIRWKRKQ